MIETVTVEPEENFPSLLQRLNPLWWLRTGDSWHAPAGNNGSPYWPEMKIQFVRDLVWWFRNPAGNLVGGLLGLAPYRRTIVGEAPVMITTWRDARPPRTGWKWAVTNGWAPFVSYWGGRVEFYCGWRTAGGGLGFKLALRESAYSDQPNYV